MPVPPHRLTPAPTQMPAQLEVSMTLTQKMTSSKAPRSLRDGSRNTSRRSGSYTTAPWSSMRDSISIARVSLRLFLEPKFHNHKSNYSIWTSKEILEKSEIPTSVIDLASPLIRLQRDQVYGVLPRVEVTALPDQWPNWDLRPWDKRDAQVPLPPRELHQQNWGSRLPQKSRQP